MIEPMKILTKRDVIKEVATRWSSYHEYFISLHPGGDESYIFKRLSELDLSKASAKEVDKIIGNSIWTSLKCENCKQDVSKVVILQNDSYDEYAPNYYCQKCIEDAFVLFNKFDT